MNDLIEPHAPITDCDCHACAIARRDDLAAAGHRLALELECLLLDTKDIPTVSRWWKSGMDALEGWHKQFPYNGPRLGD